MRWGQRYFAVQAAAGVLWWVAVFTVPVVRTTTLGALDPVLVAVVDLPLFVGASLLAAFGGRRAAVLATGWTAFVTVALAVYATVSTAAGWGVLVMAAATAGSVVALCLLVLGRVPTAWVVSGPFAFRPAAIRSSTATHVATTSAQIVVFWGLCLVVIPVVVAALEHRWALAFPFPGFIGPVGVVILGAASALGLWSAYVMSTLGRGTPLPSAMPNSLVIAGPYRWVRNPMAIAGIVQGVAVGLFLSSWLVVAYALAGSLVWNYVIRPYEEADLERRFGDEFRRYRDTVRCWLPRIPADQRAPAINQRAKKPR
ncbi:MAG: isoprenylcysteine carboxylmethyltransferase family protein [Cryobacterium sp.]